MTYWRLIPLLQASGHLQMAIDNWLLEQHRLGLHPPTLRFYTWKPAAISLGYHQHQWPEAWQHLTWQGEKIELVKRPTGGRAVLHQGDLTYAVVTSKLSGDRLEVYQTLCEFLIEGWRSLGVNLHYGNAGRGYIGNPSCFATATRADLVMDDQTKLIGSAQLRRGSAILQHGSIYLEPDLDLFNCVFGTDRAFSLAKLPLSLSRETLIPTAIAALTRAASHCFGIEFIHQPLTEIELKAIAQ